MYISKTLGRFNLISNEKRWQVGMLMPDGKFLSELWPEDEEPDIDGVPPSVILEMIEKRLNSYLFKSDRDKDLARIAAYREQAEQLDDAWARAKIAQYERLANNLRCYLVSEDAA
ncbi:MULTISPECIES: hypothetical protein [unclassified Achromobacter]|uniref:hypothetical protein n=1 Tax=unclassified Achromobacter TaxID=2626865 RepID=UPI000B519FDB|nr:MULTISPECIES: hypothetical protein [unclassified Achromobacter]OWT68063.1 hypothetical protein CEY05_28940 [Achromobacter sp. HZ34]OWT69900.1 hypothetical protein CEY04_27770 [Achromobacter sp. HZ28]